MEAFNAFLEGKVFDFLAKIYQIFLVIVSLIFWKEKHKNQNTLPSLSHQNRNSLRQKEEIFSSISLLLAHLGIKGGDRETTLELGIHKAWSFHPLLHLGRNFKELWGIHFVHLHHHTSFVSMIPPCFKFNIYSLLLYFICLIFPWDIL